MDLRTVFIVLVSNMQKKYNIDLARANSEALGNIYSLLKLNVKSCRAKGRRQRELCKKQQQVNRSARAAHFFSFFFFTFLCRCFERLQRQTSRNFLVTRYMEEMSYMFLFTFSLPLNFSLVAASISHFLTAAVNLCCSSNKNGSLSLLRSFSR